MLPSDMLSIMPPSIMLLSIMAPSIIMPLSIMPPIIIDPELERGAVQVELRQYKISPVRSLRTASNEVASQFKACAPAGASCIMDASCAKAEAGRTLSKAIRESALMVCLHSEISRQRSEKPDGRPRTVVAGTRRDEQMTEKVSPPAQQIATFPAHFDMRVFAA